MTGMQDHRCALLADLARITPGDADAFVGAATAAGLRCWFAYFPRLYYYGGIAGHDLLWERHGESLVVYQARRRNGEVRLNLYLPPFPFDAAALGRARERMREFNGGRPGRIVFLQDTDAERVAREGFEVTLKHEEYIFDRASVMALEGSRFRTLRSQMARAERSGYLGTRRFSPSDQAACRALVETWKERLVANGMKATPYRHTIACLKKADHMPPALQAGMVVEIDGVVRGFAFSGRLAGNVGANYLCVADTDIQGLPYLLRYRIMSEFDDLEYFNDCTDSGRQGLRDLKQRFRPVEMLRIYGAHRR